jgi:predicted nucleic acid-binding protein
MSVIFDGCIVIKWFFDEEMSSKARSLGRSTDKTIAPSLILPEVSNAVWKRLSKSIVSTQEAQEICDTLPELFRELVRIEELQKRASEIMVALVHPIYDCIYLALAEREKLPLISVDQRLIDAGRRLGSVNVVHLKDL